MFGDLLKKMFGTQNERTLDRIRPTVVRVNELESSISPLSDDRLAAKIAEFRQRVEKGESLDDLLPETFAVVREAGKRVLEMRHFDVQLLGGVILHEGRIAEMRTGEGKTLVATLPIVLNSLTGRGVHLVTVNDYLARRDADWMGKLYRFLGMSVGVIVHGMDDTERQASYRCDITYGTNNEFGFDYLRDNMKFRVEDMVQRDLHYAIVDEVDSILVDEARTPLIISGPAEESTSFYARVNSVIPFLKKDTDYTVDEKARQVLLTEEAGIPKLERLLSVDNLYDPGNIEVLHHVNQALKAHILFHRDVDYMVKDGEVVIVDEFTGRLMPGRRWSDGLHQAVEAKEAVKIENENQTLATITFQNYFRMFDKLAGMTGTADTEAAEFQQIYNLAVTIVPTNQAMIRQDLSDQIYRTEKEKFHAVLLEVKELHTQGRPVLVGTVSIEKSERLSGLLTRHGVPHNVLNAKHHEQEAQIIAEAGQPGKVTIATNMAGRGVDIKLGEGVVGKGGLHIIGTERHESRRVDNQLRGRAGRQGDPGSSRFYLSLEDDLLRIFGSDRISPIMEKLGMEEGEPIEHPLINRAVENAQKKVEGHNFDIRKHLLEYDDVMNKQRTVVYDMRREILGSEDLREMVLDFAGEVAEDLCREVLGRENGPGGVGFRGAFHRRLRPVRIPAGDPGGGEGYAYAIRPRGSAAGGGGGVLCEEGSRLRRRRDPVPRADVSPLHGGRAVEGSPPVDGSSKGGDRTARVRSEGPAKGVPAGGVRPLLGPDLTDQGGNPQAPVPRQGAAGGGGGGFEGTSGRASPCTGHPLPRGHQERREDHAEARGRQDRQERSLSLRVGEEVQEMLRRERVVLNTAAYPKSNPGRRCAFGTPPFGCAASEGGAPFVARRAMNPHGCALPHFAPPPAATPPDPSVACAFRADFSIRYRIYETRYFVRRVRG